MHVLGRHVREDDAVRHVRRRPLARRLQQVLLAKVREAEEPQDGFGHFVEDAEPGAEGCWFDLVASVSALRGEQVSKFDVPCTVD